MFSHLHQKSSSRIQRHIGGFLKKSQSQSTQRSFLTSPSFVANLTRAVSVQLGYRMYLTTPFPLQIHKTSGKENEQSPDVEENPEISKGQINNQDVPSQWTLDAEVYAIPHPEKKYKGGEDAHAISKSGELLAVFDGVGGWADVGVDPREYAVKLSEGFQIAADEKHIKDPKEAIRFAYKYAEGVVGTSTACAVALDGDTLHSANIGDSGFLIIRPPNELIFKSEEQQHVFNMPYQLGYQSSDTPDSAECHSIKVQEGDIVLLCTDGLLDNLEEDTILELVKKEYIQSSYKIDIRRLAQTIVKNAYNISQDPKAITPFGYNARRYGYRFRGGKPDDITLIVSMVSTNEKAQLRRSSRSETNEETETTDVPSGSPSFFQRLFGMSQWFTLQSRL